MAKIEVKDYLDEKYVKLNMATKKMDAIAKVKPKLVTFLIGDRKDSETYVRNKEKSIDRAGMTSETIRIPDGTPFEKILKKVVEVNYDPRVNGILIQLPLNRDFYSKKDEELLINVISPLKDVDGLSMVNQAKLFIGEDQNTFLTPCTPTGIVKLLKESVYNNSLKGLDITVVGRSQLLGNSLAQMLMREDANVTTLHSKSGWIMYDYLSANAVDVLCLCAGQPNLIHASDLDAEQDYTIIDAAMNVGEDGKLRGDFCKEDYKTLDEWSLDEGFTVDYTSVPGGVGPITTYTLAYNLYKAACLQHKLTIENI